MRTPLSIVPSSPRRNIARSAPLEPAAEHLDDAALLALVLGNDLPSTRAMLGRSGSLKGLLRRTADSSPGLTVDQLSRLGAAVELGRRALVAQWHPVRLSTAREVYQFLLPHLGGRREERFHVVGLDSRNAVLGDACVAVGSVDSVQVDPREVFSRALAWRATGLVVGHPHPSGDPEPSLHDIAMTRQLADCAKLLGMRLLDHLIVGDGAYVSLKERGAIP
jgi:DNA repair protein RadC